MSANSIFPCRPPPASNETQEGVDAGETNQQESNATVEEVDIKSLEDLAASGYVPGYTKPAAEGNIEVNTGQDGDGKWVVTDAEASVKIEVHVATVNLIVEYYAKVRGELMTKAGAEDLRDL